MAYSVSKEVSRVQTLLGVLAVFYMGVRSYSRKSLTIDGIFAATLVGLIHAIHPFRILLLLLVFFLCGTKLTHWGDEIKGELLRTEHLPAKGDRKGRTAVQVFCNSGPAAVLAVLHMLYTDLQPISISHSWNDLFVIGIIAQYSCSAADTFSSEIGILNESWPLLITTLRKVPPGTNGGISVLGLIAALMGGGIIGITSVIVIPTNTWSTKFAIFCIATTSGLFGSLADSLLGATCQRTVYDQEMKKVVEMHGGQSLSNSTRYADEKKYIILGHDLLDNNLVNLVSALLTIAATMLAVSLLSLTFSFR